MGKKMSAHASIHRHMKYTFLGSDALGKGVLSLLVK